MNIQDNVSDAHSLRCQKRSIKSEKVFKTLIQSQQRCQNILTDKTLTRVDDLKLTP